MPKLRAALYTLLIVILTGCSGLAPAGVSSTSTPEATATSVVIAAASPTPTPAGPRTIHLWLPPEFDPAAGTPAGDLLQARLDEFETRRPGLAVVVRIKSTQGTASLLNSLTAASQAAPGALPDLVALPRPDLEAAVLKGILHPLDGLTTLIDDPDWYGYARQLAHVQNSTYGLPFAADALVLLYRPDPDTLFAPTWENFRELETQIIFPADDPQSALSLCLYLAAGGALLDEQGQPTLEAQPLTSVLTFYQSELVSPAVTQYQTDEQIWEAYRLQSSTAAVTWAASYLNETPADSALAPIPGLEGSSCSLATGWIWALAGSNPDMQPVAVELAEFLSDSKFLSAWTAAAGYLPPRPNALAAWPEDDAQLVFQEISTIAQPFPSASVTLTLGPVIQKAVLSVLQEQVAPADAAQTAIESLK